MSKKLTKSRFFMLHPATNRGKTEQLETLHQEYVLYLRICVELMCETHRFTMPKSAKQAFFPRATNLTSQIEKNARDHAIQIVSTWAKNTYARRMKKVVTNLRKDGRASSEQARSLYTVGKFLLHKPCKRITQAGIDHYNQLIDDHGGRKPSVEPNIPMRLSEMTAPFEDPQEKRQRGKRPSKPAAKLADHWMHLSVLGFRKMVWLPVVGNPYVQTVNQVGKGILARKTKKGRWRFEAVDKIKDWEAPEPSDLLPDAPRLGVDVGLNVLAAASNGVIYGASFKPKFDRAYKATRNLRANRQRQELKTNSPRLDRLESKLSGRVKTETGRIANLLVKHHPDTVFVLEDLDLRGCRGQKRFAYRALATALASKAPVEVVNPAYTSQECPSCGYISRSNRSGTKFRCRSCGRKAHADWVGASGILRRSGDNDIGCADRPNSVKATLQRRYLLRRSSPARSSTEPSPLGQSLTTEVPELSGIGTGSNLVPILAFLV